MNPHVAFFVGTPNTFGMRVALGLVAAVSESRVTHCEFGNGHYMLGASAANCGVFKMPGERTGADWVKLPVADWVWESALELYENEKGAGYDWLGALRFGLPFLARQSTSRWFCSEFCAMALGYPRPWRVLPCDIYHEILGT